HGPRRSLCACVFRRRWPTTPGPGHTLGMRSPAPLKTLEQERRALAERAANESAAEAGYELPVPDSWDAVAPPKVSRSATADEVQASYAPFRLICRPRPRKQHRL